MASTLPTASLLPGTPQPASQPDREAPREPPSSSPRSSNSSSGSGSGSGSGGSNSDSGNDKADESLAPSSEAGDSSLLRHPKGKRKRTAAKDKAILESAYLANPKPDKAARLNIVSQVSLNEKEVQIWFQNRRQNDRRKSRPLSAEEIAALRYGGLHAFSSDPPPPFGHPPLMQTGSIFSAPYTSPDTSSPPHLSGHHHFASSASMKTNIPSMTPASSPELGPWMPEALAQKLAEERRQQQQQQQKHQASEGPRDRASAAAATPDTTLSFSGSIGSVGYLANRWNLHSSFSTPSSLSLSSTGSTPGGGASSSSGSRNEPVRLEPFVRPSSAVPVLPQPAPRQQQQQPPPQQHRGSQPGHSRPFRLSLSLDGKAEVISSQSPSPPRRLPPPHSTLEIGRRTGSSGSNSSNSSATPLPALPAIRRSGLSRSHSALPSLGLTLPPISSLTSSLSGGGSSGGSVSLPLPQNPVHPPRLLRGRSRDVHAWESVCDAETRLDDELSAHAEQDASGSAIAAISLLRSVSSSRHMALAAAAAASSSSSVLRPNGSKSNMGARAGGLRHGMKRAKLGRAMSSVARMQSGCSSGDAAGQRSGEKDKVWADDDKKKRLKLSTLLSGNDSDKENWSPDKETSTQQERHAQVTGRRPLPSSRKGQQQKPVLGSQKNALLATRFTAGGGGKAGGKGFDGLDIYEDGSSEDGNGTPSRRLPLARAATLPVSGSGSVPAPDEVERFMRGADVSPSKKGDMDCVAGLLSLSQGNWR